MSISCIHSFLVAPGKLNHKAAKVNGVQLPHTGKLFEMLESIYKGAVRECDIDIVFRSAADGSKQNDSRDLLMKYLSKKDVDSGLAIAAHLQACSTGQAGLGLLFLIVGKDDGEHRLILARFPADTGVMAELKGNALNVKFVEEVFMKNKHAYKSVLYRCQTIAAGFWKGTAVDRQIDETRATANYWIGDFLRSDLLNTSAAGTKRIALAFQEAISSEQDATIKQELVLASQMARGKGGKITSGLKISEELSLSKPAQAALQKSFPRKELYASTFKFNADEYAAVMPYRAVDLDNGATMIADNAKFEAIFKTDSIGNGDRKRYVTEGRIVNQRLQKRSR